MVVESGRELEGALHDLRRLAHGVFPRILADEGLPSALAAAARQATLPASVEIDGVGRLPVDIESAVYFCCHEALQNAAKHAGPGARATIRLSVDGTGALEVEISDDGIGFDTGSTAVGRRAHEHVGSRAGVPRDIVRRVRPRDGHENPGPDSSMTSTCAGFAGAPGRARSGCPRLPRARVPRRARRAWRRRRSEPSRADGSGAGTGRSRAPRHRRR